MSSERTRHKQRNAKRRNEAVAEALANLNKAQQYEIVQFKVINERGHVRVWRHRMRDKHVDWWPYHRKAKLRTGNRVTRHRVSILDHILDLLDTGEVNRD